MTDQPHLHWLVSPGCCRTIRATGYQYHSGVMSHNDAIYHNQVKVGQHDLPEP